MGERLDPRDSEQGQLYINDFALLNREVADFLRKFGKERERGFKFTPSSVTYYIHRSSAIISPVLIENLIELRGKSAEYLRIMNLESEARPLMISDFVPKAELTVTPERVGPLYIATLEIEELLSNSLSTENFFDHPRENVARFISPRALAPSQHLVWDVLNQDRDGSIYTVDQEGSLWSFHLSPKGWSYEQDKARLSEVRSSPTC